MNKRLSNPSHSFYKSSASMFSDISMEDKENELYVNSQENLKEYTLIME